MKSLNRRSFIRNSGLALGAGTLFNGFSMKKSTSFFSGSWMELRNQFNLSPGKIHMALMLLASHPRPVREAIERHRKNFDENPAEYWEKNWVGPEKTVLDAAARYLGADPQEIMLTDSTTMGLGLLYSGLRLKPGDEILTTTHDHYSTEKSLEYASMKNGASIRRISLYEEASTVSADEIAGKLKSSIRPETRIIAVTWVHSCTGMKLPLKLLSEVIQDENRRRGSSDRIYFCVDGVHGFGVENVKMRDLGCDFFVAGTHKWLFGPRGTGILWGKKEAAGMIVPTIPAFRYSTYGNWLGLVPEDEIGFSDLCSPGGFHAFEHRWSLNEAFDLHMSIGKDKIEARTHELNSMLKEGIKKMEHVKLHTPLDPHLSAGINCFEVAGLQHEEVVQNFHEKNIIASDSPYRVSYARLTPSVINTEEEVERCLEVLGSMRT